MSDEDFKKFAAIAIPLFICGGGYFLALSWVPTEAAHERFVATRLLLPACGIGWLGLLVRRRPLWKETARDREALQIGARSATRVESFAYAVAFLPLVLYLLLSAAVMFLNASVGDQQRVTVSGRLKRVSFSRFVDQASITLETSSGHRYVLPVLTRNGCCKRLQVGKDFYAQYWRGSLGFLYLKKEPSC